MGSARVSRVGEAVSGSRTSDEVHDCSDKDCFDATPLQRMRSNGQAFQPTRETRALPGSCVTYSRALLIIVA